MRYAAFKQYGDPDNVEIREAPLPEPGPDEVLIKVMATSLNASDIEVLRGDAIIRVANGLRKPKNPRLGCDLSGIIEKIGSAVTEYQLGDEIFVDLMYNSPAYGALAEYVVVSAGRLRKKSSAMSFEKAATIGQAGVLAVQAIREPIPPSSDMRVLINGAGGGVGSFAIQLAKQYNAHITAVDHPDKFDFMIDLGADQCISYLDTDFTKTGEYDIIIDSFARKSLFAYRRALKPGGRYRMVGGSLRRILGVGLGGMITSKFSDKDVGLLIGRPNDAEDMQYLTELYEQGVVLPQIDKTYPLEEVQAGLWQVYNGTSHGKIVIKMT